MPTLIEVHIDFSRCWVFRLSELIWTGACCTLVNLSYGFWSLISASFSVVNVTQISCSETIGPYSLWWLVSMVYIVGDCLLIYWTVNSKLIDQHLTCAWCNTIWDLLLKSFIFSDALRKTLSKITCYTVYYFYAWSVYILDSSWRNSWTWLVLNHLNLKFCFLDPML